MTFYLIYNRPTGCQYAWIDLATLSQGHAIQLVTFYSTSQAWLGLATLSHGHAILLVTFNLIYNSPTGLVRPCNTHARTCNSARDLLFNLQKPHRMPMQLDWLCNTLAECWQPCLCLEKNCERLGFESKLTPELHGLVMTLQSLGRMASAGWVLAIWQLLATPSKSHAILGYAYIRCNSLQLFCVFPDGLFLEINHQ